MRCIYNFVPQTLFTRFLLIITVPTIICQIAAIYIFYYRHWDNVLHYTSGLIANEISLIVDRVQSDDLLTAHMLERALDISYTLKSNQKIVDIKSSDIEALEIFHDALYKKINSPINVFLSPDRNRIMVDIETSSGLMNVQFAAKILLNPTTYIFVIWIVSLALLLLLIALVFSKNQIRSVLALTKAADQFGKGIKNSEYKPSGAKEIRMAGVAFLRMRDRIEKQINRRTQILAMISHDLRTPITRIKLQLELMDDKEELSEIVEDVKSMEYMISSYLDFARGEGGEDFQNIIAGEWFLQNMLSIKPPSLELEVGPIEKISKVNIKPQAFKRAIVNILNNAAKYSTKVQISIKLRRTNGVKELDINIEDNGDGIDDAEKKLVFKPFYRSDRSRHFEKNDSSVGLGLAITKEIINGHNSAITLHDSKKLGGLLVKITMPII